MFKAKGIPGIMSCPWDSGGNNTVLRAVDTVGLRTDLCFAESDVCGPPQTESPAGIIVGGLEDDFFEDDGEE